MDHVHPDRQVLTVHMCTQADTSTAAGGALDEVSLASSCCITPEIHTDSAGGSHCYHDVIVCGTLFKEQAVRGL